MILTLVKATYFGEGSTPYSGSGTSTVKTSWGWRPGTCGLACPPRPTPPHPAPSDCDAGWSAQQLPASAPRPAREKALRWVSGVGLSAFPRPPRWETRAGGLGLRCVAPRSRRPRCTQGVPRAVPLPRLAAFSSSHHPALSTRIRPALLTPRPRVRCTRKGRGAQAEARAPGRRRSGPVGARTSAPGPRSRGSVRPGPSPRPRLHQSPASPAAVAPARRSPRASAAAVAASPPRSAPIAAPPDHPPPASGSPQARSGSRYPEAEFGTPETRRLLSRSFRAAAATATRGALAPRGPRDPGRVGGRPERAAQPGQAVAAAVAVALWRPVRGAPCRCGAAAAPWPVISGDFSGGERRGWEQEEGGALSGSAAVPGPRWADARRGWGRDRSGVGGGRLDWAASRLGSRFLLVTAWSGFPPRQPLLGGTSLRGCVCVLRGGRWWTTFSVVPLFLSWTGPVTGTSKPARPGASRLLRPETSE